jgi:hypothetical protein
MPLQLSGPISLLDVQNEFGGSNPIGINEYYAGGTYVASRLNGGTKAPIYGSGGGAYPPSGWTGIQNSSIDDGFIQLPTLPFNFYINNTAYTAVYIGSNSYLTFGSGSSLYSGLSASVPALPKLMFGAADNSYQRVSTFTYGTDFVSVRYEGNGGTSGTVGSPGIVAEITLYNPSNFSGNNVIQMLVGNWNGGAVSNISNASTAYATFQMYANQSFVFVGNSTGTSWSVNTGYYIGANANIPSSGAISLFNFYETSAAAGGATGAVTPSTSSVNEGSGVTFNITSNQLSTTLYWTLNIISGTINASDFTGAAVSGSFSTDGTGAGSVALTLANDATTEGTESFQLQVRTGSTSGTIVATSTTVTINDTSLTPGFSWSTEVMGYGSGNSYGSGSGYSGNVVTPGAGNSPVTFNINMQAQDGDGTLSLYVGGSLVQTWTKSSSPTNTVYSYTSTFGASSLQFQSVLNDYNLADGNFSRNQVSVGATIVFIHTQDWAFID